MTQTLAAPSGYTVVAAAQRLLTLLGVDASAYDIRQACAGEPSAEALPELLLRYGTEARLAQLDPSELQLLSLPTLVMLKAGGAAILTAASRRGVTLQLADGRGQAVALDDARRWLTGQTLDIGSRAIKKGRFVARLWNAYQSQRRALLQLCFAIFAMAISGLLLPAVSRVAVDRALPDRAEGLLAAAASCMLLLSLQRTAMGLLRERILAAIDAHVQTRLVAQLVSHVVRLPIQTLGRYRLGSLMEVFETPEGIVELCTRAGIMWCLDFVVSFLYCGIVALILPGAALAMLLLALACLTVSAALARRQALLQACELDAAARQRSTLLQLLGGVATLKATRDEERATEHWLRLFLRERTVTYQRERTLAWETLALEAAQQLSLITVLTLGAIALLEGSLSLGSFMACTLLADSFGGSLSRFSSGMLGLGDGVTQASRLDGLLEEPSPPRMDPRDAVAEEDAIVMEDVWFRYGPDQPWVLRGYNLRVKVGEELVLSGPSGSGKSTILRLVAGLYTPERGKVTVFGRTPGQVQRHMTYVPQQAYLFEGSIEENLRLLSRASTERLLKACQRTRLADFIATLPMGFETRLPPGGQNLSGGQRQLIALTAAVASDCSLLLLDESLSQIDSLNKAFIKGGRAFRGRTILAVAHDA